MPAGLLVSGWAAEKGVHWIVADIGMSMVGAGMILSFQSIQTYLVDTFTLFAASGEETRGIKLTHTDENHLALAAVTFVRSMFAFGFPLFAPAMYDKLGYGKGDTVLAIVAIVIGCPA